MNSTITHHAGQTGGYASYLALDRQARKAVIVLSDVANDASGLGDPAPRPPQIELHDQAPPEP